MKTLKYNYYVSLCKTQGVEVEDGYTEFANTIYLEKDLWVYKVHGEYLYIQLDEKYYTFYF